MGNERPPRRLPPRIIRELSEFGVYRVIELLNGFPTQQLFHLEAFRQFIRTGRPITVTSTDTRTDYQIVLDGTTFTDWSVQGALISIAGAELPQRLPVLLRQGSDGLIWVELSFYV